MSKNIVLYAHARNHAHAKIIEPEVQDWQELSPADPSMCLSLPVLCVCLRREVCGSAVVDARTAQETHTNRNTTSTKKSGFVIFILLPPCVCLRRVGWVSCGNSQDTRTNRNTKIHTSTQEYQWMLLVLIGILLFASSISWRCHRVKSSQRIQNAFRTRNPYLPCECTNSCFLVS